MAIQYTANTTAYQQLDLVPGNPNVVTITDLSNADDAVATIELGANNFKFYDTVYTSLKVDSNGRIVLGTEESEYINTDLTSEESTSGIIAPFWDDLNTQADSAASGSAEDDLIVYQIEGDRLIIEWNNVHFYSGGESTDGITFQAILQLNTGTANGNIIFNYPDLTEQELEDNNGTSATVGVKAPGSQTTSSFDRTLVSFNQTNALVGASKAIVFTPTTINPNIPRITSGTAVTVAENSTQTYTVTATAPEGASLIYSLSGTDANLFNIDSSTGLVTFKTAPDFETPTDNGADNVYNINVIANNSDLSDTREVAITVTDVNEAPPSNTQYIVNATTYENLDLIPGNPNVVTITDLSNADDAVATIELGANNFKFYDTVYTSLKVDSNGRIVLGTEESEYINTDLTSEESTSGIISPFWDDLNTQANNAASGSVEDDLIVYQIEGDRLIIEWNNVHFYSGGESTDGITFQAILQLNTGTANGNIIFNYPDLTEQELEDNNGTSATVGVKAPGSQTTSSFDRTLVSFNQTNALVGASKAIVFTPTTINPNIPKITSGTAVTVAENSTQTAYTVTATAPEGASLIYSLSGTDANLFNIDSSTGLVTFKTAPDFETPTDNGADNVYNINVIANNSDLSDTREVAITVTDVNEAPPSNTQYIVNPTTYENLDLIPGNPNVVTITDLSDTDDAVATINLGTNNFKFYDTVYTSLTIDSNGRIVLGTEESEYDNTNLTSEESTSGIIAPFWDDLNTQADIAASGSAEDNLILYQIEGDRLIIEWNNVHFYDGGETADGITFQAILQLNTGTANGNIIFNYPDLTEQELEDNNGTSATVGVKAPGSQTTSSFDRTLVSFNQTNALVGASKAIVFTPTTINPNIPKITSGTAVTVAENSTQTAYTVTATAPEGTTLTYSISGTDANLFNINSSTGLVTFKTAPDFEIPTDNGADNVYNINVIANNSDLSDTREVAITVTDVNEAPVFKNPLLDQTTNENQTFSFQIPTNIFTDIDADDVLTYLATLENGDALPSWLTFNSIDRTFSGTPTNDNVGSLNIKVTATDKAGANVSDIFVIAVENINNIPTLVNAISDQNAKQGNAFNFQIPTNTFTDIDAGDVLTYSATLENGDTLPSWLTFNSANQTFSGTPTNDNVGNLNVKVTATDKTGVNVSDIFAIAVENINDAPTLANAIPNQTTNEDTAFNFQIPTNTFTDIDAGDVLTYSATLENGNALPNWLTFNSTTQTFSGTPSNDNVGNLNVKVAATDTAGASVNDIFVIAVEKIIDNNRTTVGTPGDDNLIATPGSQFDGQNDIVFTGAGKDEVELSTVSVFPNSGNNIVDLGSGDDTIFVNKGDRAFGSDGNDNFDARDGQGGNRISGGAGDDSFYLGSNDRVLGGDGNDIFRVGLGGSNLISGGAGADQFWIVNAELPKAANTVLDFQLGTDAIGINGAVSLGITTSTLLLNQVGVDTAIVFNNQTLATLTGIQASSLSLTDSKQFVFA